MSNLWVKVARADGDDDFNPSLDEKHHQHSLHPAFAAAGIKEAPCGFSRCPDMDFDHSDAFDRAETKGYEHYEGGTSPPTEHLDLSKPLHGFEPTCDMHTLRRYTHHPETRKGLPTVFRHQGGHYIMNGHHGLSGALRRGDTHMDVHMIDLDQED